MLERKVEKEKKDTFLSVVRRKKFLSLSTFLLSSFTQSDTFLYSHYRPLSGRSNFRSPNSAVKFPRTARAGVGPSLKSSLATNTTKPVEGKSTSSVQTDISALPHQWRSETQLSGGAYCLSGITLPSTSKFNSQRNAASRCGKNTLK